MGNGISVPQAALPKPPLQGDRDTPAQEGSETAVGTGVGHTEDCWECTLCTCGLSLEIFSFTYKH